MSSPRIDKLTPGAIVTLCFGGTFGQGGYTEKAMFLGITGQDQERHAQFRSFDDQMFNLYDWEAYRYQGHWAYGTSAAHLSLVEVH